MLDREYEIMYRLENSHWWFAAKKRYIEIILDCHLKDRGGNILDVGCGTGGMIELFKKYGRVFGMDRHEAACEYSRQRNKFSLIKGDANKLPFKKGTFRLITMLDVLYHQHILEDEKVLEQIYGLLAPNGLILITDSAFEFLKSTHDIAVMARHRYTLKELKAKLKSSHYLIIKSTYLYFSIFPAVVMSRLVGKLTLFFLKPSIHSDLKKTNPFLNKFLTGLLNWEGSLLKHISFPWGSSLLILGKKR
jgi:ubiquinone/menaquinone biosynthesis C-methylase UbiE